MFSDRRALRKSLAGVTLWLPGIYVVVAVVVGLALCVLTPPFFAPDESAHAMRAIEIGHGGWVGVRSDVGVGGWIDAGVVEAAGQMGAVEAETVARYPVAHDRPDGRVTEAQMEAVRRVGWTHRAVFASFQNTAVYPPALYLPQAVGWRVGEAAGWSIVASLRLARVLDLLTAVGLGWLALRLWAGTPWVLFGCLLLPTSLSLEASCSQDAVLFSVAAVVAALLLRALAGRRVWTGGELVGAAVLVGICVGARAPYLPLVLVLVLPWVNAKSKERLGWAVAAVVAVVVVCGAWQVAVRPLGTFVPVGIEPARQVAFLQGHPVSGLVKMTEGTLREAPGLAVKGLETLGTNDVFPPVVVYGLLLLGFAGLVGLSPGAGLTGWWGRALMVVAVLGVVAAISLAEYLIWTPVGAGRVLGLQARYYLPLVPLGFLLADRRNVAGWWRRLGLVVAAGLLVVGVAATPWVAAQRFYRSGPGAAIISALRR